MISGWCSQHGKPNCAGCRSSRCCHECHASPVDSGLPNALGAHEDVLKDTTKRVGPGPHGVGAPVQGLAGRKDTTDS